MRQAVNYAIDRAALARIGNPFFLLPADPTDHYLPPGIPGHVDGHIYPLVPDLTKARRLAKGHAGATAVLYTFDRPASIQQAQILKNDLAAIGVRVVVKAFPVDALFARLATPGEPFDIAYVGWFADYPDPQGVLDPLLENSSNLPPLDDPSYRAKLRARHGSAAPNATSATPGSTGMSSATRRPSPCTRTYTATSSSPPGWAARPTGSTASTSQRCASRDPPTEGQRRGSPDRLTGRPCTRESSSGRRRLQRGMRRGPKLRDRRSFRATRDSERRVCGQAIWTGTALATAAARSGSRDRWIRKSFTSAATGRARASVFGDVGPWPSAGA